VLIVAYVRAISSHCGLIYRWLLRNSELLLMDSMLFLTKAYHSTLNGFCVVVFVVVVL